MSSEMITHRAIQGTQEWLDIRAKFHTASEANAMMGCCSHTSRTQLLDQKKTGITPEPSNYEKQLFALGHKLEDMARPIVEGIIDEDLFQLVASKDDLLASFDGITMMGDIGFEHKMWNEKLAECVRNGIIPDTHVWQLEQQLYVSDAEKIIFVVSDGTTENMVHCWYESDPIKRKQLLSGWKKFDEDLKTHVPGQDKLEGKSLDQLMQLSIQVQGHVLASNLEIFTSNAVETIESIKTELVTDQDFADAEKAVKWCKNAEKSLTEAKANVLSQSTDINAILAALDEINEKVRGKRLTLDKLVKSQKEYLKNTAITQAENEILTHLRAQKYTVDVNYSLEFAVKNKKTLSSINDSIFLEVSRTKAAIDEIVDRIDQGIAYIAEHAQGYEFLFGDKEKLAETYSGENLADAVKFRIENFKQDQAAALEAESNANKKKAELEAARLIEQAKRQKEKPAQTEIQPDYPICMISAAALNSELYFDHAPLAKKLGYEVDEEYSYENAAKIVEGMITYLADFHAELTK